MRPFKAAIFDMDGTLIDSNGAWEQINRLYLGRHGISLGDEELQKFASMTFEEVAQHFIHVLHIPTTVEELIRDCNDMIIEQYRSRIPLKPHALEYLHALRDRGIKIALATASSARLYTAALENHGIHGLFDAFATTEEAGRGKEFPDVYLLAAEKMEVRPEECAVFEDILRGVQSAKAAGMQAVGVYDFYSEPRREAIQAIADRYIQDFSEMMDFACI